MRDVDRLLAAFEEGTLLRPSAGVLNSVDLALAIATLAGVEGLATTHGARRISSLVGDARHLIFVLVDGLGVNLVDRLDRGSFLRDNNQLQLQTVFPSTTVAALTSLATGVWPGQHGVPTWWAYLSEFDTSATVLPFIERFSKRPLSKWGIESRDVFCTPSLTVRYPRDVRSFMPKAISSSVYTAYSSSGAEVVAYTTLAGAVDAVLERVRDARDEPTYSYLYYPRVDAFSHDYGPDHELVRSEVLHVSRELSRLHASLARRASIVVTADHGLVAIPERGRHRITREGQLMSLLKAPPSGEPRVPLFHVREGQNEEFERQFRSQFGDTFALLAASEAEDLRLFGPELFSDVSKRRIGDYVAVALGEDVLAYEPPEWMTGFHAGLTPAEMLVPLVVA